MIKKAALLGTPSIYAAMQSLWSQSGDSILCGLLLIGLIFAGAYGIKRLHDRGVSKW